VDKTNLRADSMPAGYLSGRPGAMKTDSNPLNIKINMAGGHGRSSGRYDVLRERAFRYAFMLDAVGMTNP
jgi:protease II